MRKALVGLVCAAFAAHAAPFVTGDVFASTGDGRVRVYSQSGTFKQELNTGLGGFTTGSTFDQSGNFYVTAFSANQVAKFDASGNLVNAAWSSGFGSRNESIVFDAAGDAYIGYAGTAQIRKVNSSGAQIATYSVNQNTDWIDLAADQTTLVYSDEGNVIAKWDVGSNTDLGNFITGSGPFFAKRIRPGSGELLVASGNGSVYRYSSAGVLLQTYAVGIGGVFALNLDPDGSSFWTGTVGGQTVAKVDIATGTTLQSWSTGTGQLFGLAVLGEIQAGGGSGTGGNGEVPEPSTYLLTGLGFAALGLLKRHRA